MIDHVSSYATDYDKTKQFYDAVLPLLGYPCVMQLVTTSDPEWPTRRLCGYGPGGKPYFWLVETRDEATPRHMAFAASSRGLVDAFHRAGLEAGAEDNGGPGLREHYHPTYYGAFLIDPDGNNIEAVSHGDHSVSP